MNIGSYESIFTAINEKEVTILDFTDYANKLLNNGNKNLFQKPDLFISVFTQAERLISPDILTIDVNPFYQVFLEEEEGFVQSLKGKRIPVIVLKEKDESNFSLEALLDCYQPITNVAKHYKWPIGLQTDSTFINPAEIREKIDFCLNQSISFKDLQGMWENGLIVGGGLNHLFWTGDFDDVITKPKKGILFGKIPHDANPETVLAQLQILRS